MNIYVKLFAQKVETKILLMRSVSSILATEGKENVKELQE